MHHVEIIQEGWIDASRSLQGQVLSTVQNQVAGKYGGWEAWGPNFDTPLKIRKSVRIVS